ncbi:hypothetical protein K491DRAFT_698136 [Lophiostoma macrostomum CBS 122681]|uniref:Uncharacterized protein n=1 Tax=Lophiostoma macrostomum CBS 122681 TaxID=1314788 RepID=A0A6A6SNC8_9PLEO|nr:hypothetical protein K491DRAFT_698136 [Lophiostoma macrostomum CBS 122681]
MIEIKTELEYHVHDFTSKITRSTAPKKKEPKKKEPKKKGPAKAQPGPTKTKGSPANVTPEPMEPNLKEWIPEGPPYQHESPRMLEPRVQHLQNPVRGWETGPQAGSSSSSYLEDQLRLRDAKILEQSKTIEELKSMIADYKRMHKAEKKLAEKAEDEIERLKEQCKRRNEPDKDQQQLREKMDAYHYELLNALRQGFGSVTIDILRATR